MKKTQELDGYQPMLSPEFMTQPETAAQPELKPAVRPGAPAGAEASASAAGAPPAKNSQAGQQKQASSAAPKKTATKPAAGKKVIINAEATEKAEAAALAAAATQGTAPESATEGGEEQRSDEEITEALKKSRHNSYKYGLIDEWIEREKDNFDQIILHREYDNFVALERSAYLMRTFFKPKSHLYLQTCKYEPTCLRTAISIHQIYELEIMAKDAGIKYRLIHDDKQKLKTEIFMGLPKIDPEKFLTWKNDYISNIETARQKMRPFYGRIPLYSTARDLTVCEMHAVSSFPGHIREVIGPKMLELGVEFMGTLRDINMTAEDELPLEDKIAKIMDLERNLDRQSYLIQVTLDMQVLNLDTFTRLASIFGEMMHQLRAWKLSLKKNRHD